MSVSNNRIRRSAIWTMAALAFCILFLQYNGYQRAAGDMAYVGVVGCLFYASLPLVRWLARKTATWMQDRDTSDFSVNISRKHLLVAFFGVLPPAASVAALYYYEPRELLAMQISVINAFSTPATPLLFFGIVVTFGMFGAISGGEE